MSDIAMMQECPRLAVLRKIEPMSDEAVTMQNYERILKRQLTLQRGHWLEDGIANSFYANGFKVIPQLELSIMLGKKQDIPVKVHFDFVLVGTTQTGDGNTGGNGESSVRVLELKSTANISNTPTKLHEMQVQGQVSLLSKCAHLPMFNLRDAHGNELRKNMTFVEICKNYLGVTVNAIKEIKDWILCVSMNEAKAFGEYFPSDWFADLCADTAQEQWKIMQKYRQKHSKNSSYSIPHAKGFCLLCSFCEYANILTPINKS